MVDFLVKLAWWLFRATKLSQRELVFREWSVFPHDGQGFAFGLLARFSAANRRLSFFFCVGLLFLLLSPRFCLLLDLVQGILVKRSYKSI